MTETRSTNVLDPNTSDLLAHAPEPAIPETASHLRDNPELLQDKQEAIGLAYEEYWNLLQDGHSIDPEEFCEHFPWFRSSLKKVLAAHSVLEEQEGELPDVHTGENFPRAGELVDDLRIVRLLGKGQSARVYLAREADTGNRPVVAKITLDATREADTLGRVHHRGVVPILSNRHYEQRNFHIVRMPWLGSATLHDLIDTLYPSKTSRAPLDGGQLRRALSGTRHHNDPPAIDAAANPQREAPTYCEEVMALALDMAEGLSALHAEGFCHRDLKPSNVLLTERGSACLMDFDLAHHSDSDSEIVGGSPAYMAPEQLLHALDSRAYPTPTSTSDQFSLGVVLYELLTGRLPFGDWPADGSLRDSMRRMHRRMTDGPLPLRQLNPHADDQSVRFVERLLQFEPRNRFRSNEELLRTCRAYFSRGRRLIRWWNRHRWSATTTVLLAVGFTAWGSWNVYSRPDPFDTQRAHALADYRSERWPSAEKRLRKLRLSRPGDREIQLLHARAQMQCGGGAEARQTLHTLYESDYEQGKTAALLAYSFLRYRNYEMARFWAKRAKTAGVETAANYNNLGASFLLSRESQRARESLEHFDRALELDSTCLPAYFNRATAYLESCSEKEAPSVAKPKLTQAYRDIRKALTLGPKCWQMYWVAARIKVRLERLRPTPNWSSVVSLLQEARRLGLNQSLLESDLFEELRTLPEFDKLRQEQSQLTPRTTMPQLCDPCPNLFDRS